MISSGHPERIGPYHVLQVIGEGGMGVVYEAEQKAPVHRRVAVKIMRVGVDTKEVVGRFEAERQALAVMDHPGIAKVLDAGATEQGRPYFAMELVRGIRLDEYCDQKRLSIRQRVELFIGICEAVQHAHQKGVIHRDLKPSNILVAEEAARARAKIIDFGVAKATGHRLTSETVVTTYGQALGTLAYMSPEQAEMSGLDVDTRTDVYSLGIVLYELLAGRVPLDPGEVGAPTFLARLIERDGGMMPLPDRVASLGESDLEATAEARRTDSGRLMRDLAGDLRWIVHKAIEKDRALRYDTANGLALDLRRYLRSDLVLARPPTTGYRIRRFVRRNRGGVAAAAVALSALLLGSMGTSIGMVRAMRAEARAGQEAAASAQVSEFLVGLFEASDPDGGAGGDVTAREILERGAANLETELQDQPVVRARLLNTMGRAYRSLGLLENARALHLEALALNRGAVGDRSVEAARSLVHLGSVRTDIGEYDAAEEELREALAIQREALGEDDIEPANTLASLGWLLYQKGALEEAESVLLEAIPTIERLGGVGRDIAYPLTSLGAVYLARGALEDAEPLLRRALEVVEASEGRSTLDYARRAGNLGAVYYMLGRYAEAEQAYRDGLTVRERLLEPGHPDLANSYVNLAELYWRTSRLEEAEQYARRALDITERAFDSGSTRLAFSLSILGRIQVAMEDWPGAQLHLERALEIQEEALDIEHVELRETLSAYADVLDATGRSADAARIRNRIRS